MNEEISISGKKLLAIKEVVSRTKYTKDYIAKLARAGSIFGVQVGRQWFVDPVSLEQFEQLSELELQVRHRQLSNTRRRERELKLVVAKAHTVLPHKTKYSRERAVAKTLALLLCGCIAGYSLYTAPNQIVSSIASQKYQLAQVKTFFTANTKTVAAVTAPPVHLSEIVFEDTVETKRIGSSSDAVVLIPSAGEINSVADVKALFSDPVEVEFTDVHQGVVRKVNQSATTTELADMVRFVMVPVDISKEKTVSEVTP